MRTGKFLTIFLSIIFVAGCGLSNIKKVNGDKELEKVLVAFEEQKTRQYYPQPLPEVTGAVLTCMSRVFREFDMSPTEKWVFAPTHCEFMAVKNRDLRFAQGGSRDEFYKLGFLNGTWNVIERDERVGAEEKPEDWVAYLQNHISGRERDVDYRRFMADFRTEENKRLGMTAPSSRFASCKKDSDCTAGNVCLTTGTGSYVGEYRCVKSCSVQQACEAGYECVKLCLGGEDADGNCWPGGPETFACLSK